MRILCMCICLVVSSHALSNNLTKGSGRAVIETVTNKLGAKVAAVGLSLMIACSLTGCETSENPVKEVTQESNAHVAAAPSRRFIVGYHTAEGHQVAFLRLGNLNLGMISIAYDDGMNWVDTYNHGRRRIHDESIVGIYHHNHGLVGEEIRFSNFQASGTTYKTAAASVKEVYVDAEGQSAVLVVGVHAAKTKNGKKWQSFEEPAERIIWDDVANYSGNYGYVDVLSRDWDGYTIGEYSFKGDKVVFLRYGELILGTITINYDNGWNWIDTFSGGERRVHDNAIVGLLTHSHQQFIGTDVKVRGAQLRSNYTLHAVVDSVYVDVNDEPATLVVDIHSGSRYRNKRIETRDFDITIPLQEQATYPDTTE